MHLHITQKIDCAKFIETLLVRLHVILFFIQLGTMEIVYPFNDRPTQYLLQNKGYWNQQRDGFMKQRLATAKKKIFFFFMVVTIYLTYPFV